MSGWISVSERLPEDDELVWLDSPSEAGIGCITDTCTYFAQSPVYLDAKHGWMTDGDFERGDTNATHWQPLPEPPCI